MAAEPSTSQIAWQGSPKVRRFQEEMARRRSEEARRIGARIAELRERHHLTQEAAAMKLKVAYRTYQSWEQGTSVPRWATRERIAKFYGVRVEEINGPPSPSSDDPRMERLEEMIAALEEQIRQLRFDVLGRDLEERPPATEAAAPRPASRRRRRPAASA